MDENRKLSGPEQRAILKEQYKKELLEERRLAQEAKQAYQAKKVSEDNLEVIQFLDVNLNIDDVLNIINSDTAKNEARFDIAMENKLQPGKTIGEEIISDNSIKDNSNLNINSKTLGDEEF